MKVDLDLRHTEVCYLDTWLPHSIYVNDVYKYIVNLDVKMCYAGFVYLFEACNKLAEEITGPSLVISGD